MLVVMKQLVKQSIVYGLGSLVNKLLGFVLLPIYTRYLTPSDYGILSLLLVTGSIFGIIAPLGLNSAMFREVIYRKSDERTVESTTLFFLIGESALLFGALIAFSSSVCRLILGSPENAYLLRLIFLTGFFNVFGIVLMARLRLHQRSALYAGLSVGRFLISALLSIYFIVVLQLGVEGLIIAGLIADAVFAVVNLLLLIPDLRASFSYAILRNMLGFGIPAVPANLASLAMTSADRYFLQHYSGSSDVGLYSLGYSIGMVIDLAVQSINLAWPAHMFTIAKQPDAKERLAKTLTYYIAGLGFASLGVSIFSREILTLMATPQFFSAYKVVPFITLSYLLYGIRFITNTGLETRNKMKYYPIFIVGSALSNLMLNYLLIPRYGVMGAAWATVLAYLFLVVVQTAINLHFWYIPYEYKRISKIALTGIVIYGVSLLIRTPNVWLNISLKSLFWVTYPFILFALHFYEQQELATLKGLFQSGLHYVRPWRIES